MYYTYVRVCGIWDWKHGTQRVILLIIIFFPNTLYDAFYLVFRTIITRQSQEELGRRYWKVESCKASRKRGKKNGAIFWLLSNGV